ncbi:MAG: rhodanese-like domain-containing protein [Flavobacteriaceae bacterium]|nr:rhodanese-like domain-containing protein [Flavobacteriaceae bacterium]
MIDSVLYKTVKFITTDSLKNNYSTFQILDTREIKEFNTSHLDGATYVGYNKFNLKETLQNLTKDQPIVVYCSIGFRSEKIAEKLKKKGFNVYNLYGGIFQWKNCGNDVVTNSGEKTEQVHCFNEEWSQWLTNGEKIYE